MIRAVIDTIMSGVGWSGPPGAVLDAALDGHFEIVASPALVGELRRVIGYPKLRAHVLFGNPVVARRLVIGRALTQCLHRASSASPSGAGTSTPPVPVASKSNFGETAPGGSAPSRLCTPRRPHAHPTR